MAELGSLSRAAERLHVAQPALSRQIRLLEEELRVPLFRRHGRGMILTEQGQDVLCHAMRVMSELEEIHAVVANESVALRGHISIGMPPSFADALSERLVTALRNAHPEATLRLVSANSGYLLEWMHRGDIDAAVLSDPKSARRLLRIEPLFDETLFLVGSNKSELSLKEAVEFRTLENRFMLLPSSGHGLRALIEGYAQETDIALTVKIEADNYSTLKSLVRNGHGVTVLPLAPIYEDLWKGTLRAAPLINPTPIRRLVISYPADRPTLRLARFAGQVMMKAIQDLATEGVWSGKMLFAGQGSGNT